MHRCVIHLVMLIVATTGAMAVPSLPAMRVEGPPPVIDGEVAGDPAWEGVPSATDFTLLGKPDTLAGQPTEAKLLYDDTHLYVAFICHEERMDRLVTRVAVPDGPVWEDDCVEVFLAPFADPGRYYHFLVNAAGVLRDERVKDETWQSGAQAAAQKRERSWSVELAIPLAALQLDETVGSTWRLNFCRGTRAHDEFSSWAPCAETFHEPESFGELVGLDLDFVPFIAASVRERAARAKSALHGIRRDAQDYTDLVDGRVVMGGAGRHLDTLAAVEAALGGPLDDARVRALSADVATVERGLDRLEARLVRLPMIRAAGDAGYLVCTESTMTKVRPDRPYRGAPADAVRVTLARNEYEAAQVVVVPLAEALRDVRVAVSDLRGPGGAVLAAENVQVNVVGYVNVRQQSGRAPMEPGLFPDPLLDNEPTDVGRDRVQSWWLTVYAPEDLPAGVYRGEVALQPGNAPETRVPLHVRVWDFTLPRASHLRSSYGVNMHHVLGRYDVAAGPGRPPGWTAGAWEGTDIQGRPDYFGSIDYELAFDYDIKHSGRRSCRVTVTHIRKGTHEWPRFCYYTPALDLEPHTDYEFSVWYRTAEGYEHGPAGYFGPAGGTTWPPTDGEWRQGMFSFNTGDHTGIRVYLRVDKVGTVWLDNTRLALKGVEGAPNLLPNPDFEIGDETGRERIRDAYFLNALRHRASPTNLLAPQISIGPDGEIDIDWTEFDEKMQLYIDHGLTGFNVNWCRLPRGWGRVETVEDEARLAQARELLRRTQAHLDEKGWTDLAYIYTIDEPGHAAFPQVKQAFELAHSAAPGLKRLLTYGYGASRPIEPGAPRYAELEGYVDIHVPHSDCYEPIYLDRRRQAGDEIWAYVCISAQRPYLNNWGIDYPGMDHRLLFWQLYDHDITGFLYWETCYWVADPWEDTMTYPGGNGDGSLIYPGPDGPVDSIRWELNRDGTEDYDMLMMLREAAAALQAQGEDVGDAERLLSFPHLTRSWTDYSEDPEELERHRLAVGDRLEALTRRLGG